MAGSSVCKIQEWRGGGEGARTGSINNNQLRENTHMGGSLNQSHEFTACLESCVRYIQAPLCKRELLPFHIELQKALL